MKKVEKLDVRSDFYRHGGRRKMKQATNRLIRRLSRALLEDAPRAVRHVTRGWVS